MRVEGQEMEVEKDVVEAVEMVEEEEVAMKAAEKLSKGKTPAPDTINVIVL